MPRSFKQISNHIYFEKVVSIPTVNWEPQKIPLGNISAEDQITSESLLMSIYWEE